jgi:broad specificity phosphatase PhoE
MGYCGCHRGGYNDQHASDAGPIPFGDLRQLQQYEQDPRFYPALARYQRVRTDYNTPFVGGSNRGGDTVYEDKRFADRMANGQIRYDGKPYQPQPFVFLHEAVEGVLIRQFGLDYPHAHRLANIAERLAVEHAGLNWNKHTAAMRPEIQLAEKESGKGTPPDLLVQPYEGTKLFNRVEENEGQPARQDLGMADQRLRASRTNVGGPQGPVGGYSAASAPYANQPAARGDQRQADDWPGKPNKGRGMQKFYLIRHGKTALNAAGGGHQGDRIRGWKDVPLDATGKKEAKRLGVKLKDSGIELIAHSNLSRSKDTAQEVADTTGAEMMSWPPLRPWNVGIYTGQDSNSAHPELQKMAIQKPDQAIPEGESFTQFKCRVFSYLGELLEKANGRHLAVVTHHRVERLIHAWIDAGQPADTSVNFDTMFQHGESPANADVIALDPNRLRAAAETACRELERIGPEKYSHEDAGYHEGFGPPTKKHPEGTHCGVCRYFHGRNKCEIVEKPIGADDGCKLFMDPPEGQGDMRKKGNKDGSSGDLNTNWREGQGPGGGSVRVGGQPGGYGRRGGYDPELPATAPGQLSNVSQTPPTTGQPTYSSASPSTTIGGYGAQIGYRSPNVTIGGGARPASRPPRAPTKSAASFHNHVLALGGLKHALAAGHIDQDTHDRAVASARSAIATHKASFPSPKRAKPMSATPPKGPSGDATGGAGRRSGATLGSLAPVPIPYPPEDSGGYGGMGSFAQQPQPMPSQGAMPWQQ